MSKTYKESNSNKKFPRGEYRARWDMPHKDQKAYDRKKDNKNSKTKDYLDIEEDIN